MGAHADAAADGLRDRLAERRPDLAWEREYRVGPTPVDVAGTGGGLLAAVELEWRRADPADNAAKLFRHLAEGSLDDRDRVVLCQVFTGYYDVTDGVSAKRKNAEFVGRAAAGARGRFAYHAVEFPLDPPKRGAEVPDGLDEAVVAAADGVAAVL